MGEDGRTGQTGGRTAPPRGWRRSPGIRPGSSGGGALPWDRVTLSVVVPCFNEIHSVASLLRRVRQVPLRLDVVVVDDGSTDGTRELLPRLKEEGLIETLVLHPENRGKGAALRSGFGRARGHVVVVQDADLEYDPGELPRLLEPILAGCADAVYGSRFLGGAPHRVHLFWHSVGNRCLTLLSNLFTDVNLTDMETCYKMIRRDLLSTLPLTRDRFGIEPEITARLTQAGARIYELPVSYHGRSYAEGKKIGWRDGVAAVWHIVGSNLLRPKAPRWRRPARAPWEAPQPGDSLPPREARFRRPLQEAPSAREGALPREERPVSRP